MTTFRSRVTRSWQIGKSTLARLNPAWFQSRNLLQERCRTYPRLSSRLLLPTNEDYQAELPQARTSPSLELDSSMTAPCWTRSQTIFSLCAKLIRPWCHSSKISSPAQWTALASTRSKGAEIATEVWRIRATMASLTIASSELTKIVIALIKYNSWC